MFNAVLKIKADGFYNEKTKKSEKLFLEEIFSYVKNLNKVQKGISIGLLLSLIRKQLGMSQKFLAQRAKVPQSTISRIESSFLEPNIATLRKIFDSLFCDLLITACPKESLEIIRQKQARIKAEKKIRYLQGTMSLEKQNPDHKLLIELIEEEERRLLTSPGFKLWED
jgi:transcriptional regulator with XRE-family HTH domain